MKEEEEEELTATSSSVEEEEGTVNLDGAHDKLPTLAMLG
jgi:hypothetical protein